MNFLFEGPEDAATTVLLAHGAGAPMDSNAMIQAAKALAAEGLRVARFEFAYMAARRTGERRPPPKAETVMPEYEAAVEVLNASGKLLIGGKSMGGRVASMVADGRVQGLICLGYPFHPPGRRTQLRTKHLQTLTCPALIVQGTRDEFGTRDEVVGYGLSPAIDLLWLEDGDHDLKPRESVSGFTAAQHLATMASAVRSFAEGLVPQP
jgi:hypothetical protein